MVDATYKVYDASDRSYYAILKKEVHAMAMRLKFPEKRISELDIILAEMTSNLYKYAKGGELLVGHFYEGHEEYIELICIDTGPGMRDVSRMLRDGFSTGTTLGHGLGSIRRLSDTFDMFSAPNWGTVLLSRVYKVKSGLEEPKKKVQFKSLVLSKPHEQTSGDAAYIKQSQDHVKFILADGLGHGPEANRAANEAINAFKLCPLLSPVDIIRFIHPMVKKTRGLVATIGVFDKLTKQLKIGGVGNISTKLTGPMISKTHLAYNGIIGHNIPNTMNDLLVSSDEYNQVTLCSDGIRSRWELNRLPGLQRADISIQAASIYKDYARLSDDMSVLIVKF